MDYIDPFYTNSLFGDIKSAKTDSDIGKNLNNYSIGKYSYPEDVGSKNDLMHSVTFFINIRGKGEAAKGKTKDVVFKVDDEQQVTKTGVIESVAIATGGAAVVAALSKSSIARRIIDGFDSKISAGAKAAALSVGLAGATVGATAASFTSSTMYRLKDAITLAIQEPPKTSYKVNYDKFDVGTLMGGMSSSPLGGATPAMIQAGLLKFATVPNVVGAPDFSKGIQKMSGEATNPFRTVLFQDVDLRTFTFNYKFMPKTANEARNVLNIIKTFKAHMHPEFSSSKVFLIHPSEFNIVFYYQGKENTNWNKISTCVLTELKLDSGTEQLATFKDGMSVEINMELTFMETEMMTREKIEQGY
jgi:hypothetical protein